MKKKSLVLLSLLVFSLLAVFVPNVNASPGITYSAATDTITITGGTEGNEYDSLDIWNADQSGGWGQVSKLGNEQFYWDCKLIFGGIFQITWFADENVQWVFNDTILSVPGETGLSSEPRESAP